VLVALAWTLNFFASLWQVPVEIVHSGFPWDAALIAVAAVLAAAIAAYTAQRRLIAQLGHDRGMRDLEEIRRILDEAAHLAAKAVSQTENAYFSIQRNAQDQEDEVRRAKQLTEEMSAMHQRLRLRFGGDPVSGSYFLAMLRLEQAVQSLENNLFSSTSNQELDRASAGIDLHKDAVHRFMRYALARAGIDAAGEPQSAQTHKELLDI
jgi:hypothetical protein